MTQPPVLSQEQEVSRKSAYIIRLAKSDMDQVHNQVDQAIITLIGQAMVSLAGQAYGKAVQHWLDDFNYIKGELEVMAETLELTSGILVHQDYNNAQLVTGITAGLQGQ